VNSFVVLSPWLEIVFVFFAGFMRLPPFFCVAAVYIVVVAWRGIMTGCFEL